VHGSPSVEIFDRINHDLASQNAEAGPIAFDALAFKRGLSDAEVLRRSGGAQVAIRVGEGEEAKNYAT
jgi:hypothetical protein